MVEKDKQESTEFMPTPKQFAFMEAFFDQDVPWTISATCKAAGVDRGSYYKWLKDPAFCKWFKEESDKFMAKLVPTLDKLGIKMSAKDFRYFEFMQRKFGGVKSPMEEGIERGLETIWGILAKAEKGKKE